MCSTEEEQIKRQIGKAARKKMKSPHTTGRKGSARVIEDLKKKSPTGTVTRTDAFLATHTRTDGSFPFVEMMSSIDHIKTLVSYYPEMVGMDLDNDPAALVCGRDGRGNVRGLGNGVSKIIYHASASYKEIAQREKRARENTEMNFGTVMARLDEKLKARKIVEEK